MTTIADSIVAALRELNRPTFVTELAAFTGRSNSAIWNALAELQWSGKVVARVYEPDRHRSGGGRPRNTYTLTSYEPPPSEAELADELFAMHVG